MSNLARRVLVAVVGIPMAMVFIYAGELPLALFLATFAALGAAELYRLARLHEVNPIDAVGVPLAACLPLGVHFARLGFIDRPLTTLSVLLIALLGLAVWARTPQQRPIEDIAVTVLGVVYCGGTLSFAYALRHHDWVVGAAAGSALVAYPLVLTWATDMVAFFVGRAVGRRRLMPSVSPGKTVAGAVGGLIGGVVASVAFNFAVLRPVAQLALAPWTALAFGVIASVAAQVGDLSESLLKREAGVKDSSNLLPGHGGVLDRLDSLYFVLPVAYLLLGRLLLPAPR